MFADINKDSWTTTDALTQCIGGEKDDAVHPVMEEQLAAQKGNDTSGQGEVRAGFGGLGWRCVRTGLQQQLVSNEGSPA